MGGSRVLSWQGSLFDRDDAGVDGNGDGGLPGGTRGAKSRGGRVPRRPSLSFDRLVRHQLDARTWLDEVVAWVPGHGDLFDELLAEAPWTQRERRMYDRMVLEPRMVAHWSGPALADLPARLAQMRERLSARYRVEFDSVGINLYRDGRDGVAWHGDNNRKVLHDPLVATVSLGERRRFLLRPGSAGSPTHRFRPGGGDLLVMGGNCQHSWQHAVPKEGGWAGARMSITIRHSREGWWVEAPSTEPTGPTGPTGTD